jgi:hypothetical protein
MIASSVSKGKYILEQMIKYQLPGTDYVQGSSRICPNCDLYDSSGMPTCNHCKWRYRFEMQLDTWQCTGNISRGSVPFLLLGMWQNAMNNFAYASHSALALYLVFPVPVLYSDWNLIWGVCILLRVWYCMIWVLIRLRNVNIVWWYITYIYIATCFGRTTIIRLKNILLP